MSISTVPVIAANKLPPMQSSLKTGQLEMGISARASLVLSEILNAPATKGAADAKVTEPVKPSAEQIKQSLHEINNVLTGLSISVQFQVDPNYSEVIIKVVDQDTGKVIRQFPSEELVRISKSMDHLTGLLLEQKA